MALSQLRMHHLRTGALPPRTDEERAFCEQLEGADAPVIPMVDVTNVPLASGEPITDPQGPPAELPPFLLADGSPMYAGRPDLK